MHKKLDTGEIISLRFFLSGRKENSLWISFPWFSRFSRGEENMEEEGRGGGEGENQMINIMMSTCVCKNDCT